MGSRAQQRGQSSPVARAFTLLELMVVVAIIGIIVAITVPMIQSAIADAKRGACISNLRQIGTAIAAYAADHESKIPYGPKAPPFSNAASFYPSTGSPTSLISLQDGSPVALGLLLKDYLGRTPDVLFCPGRDQVLDSRKEIEKVGKEQAQCSYYYRHGGNVELFDNPYIPQPEPPLRLGFLGENRRGKPIRALVIDTIFECPEQLSSFGVKRFTNHQSKVANILFTDGHVASRANTDGRFTADLKDLAQIRGAFSKILEVLETADEEP